jgi:hypothetical protein
MPHAAYFKVVRHKLHLSPSAAQLYFTVQETRGNTRVSSKGTDAGELVASAAPPFPGYKETGFSTATKRFYYKHSKRRAWAGSGGHALVEEYVHLFLFRIHA